MLSGFLLSISSIFLGGCGHGFVITPSEGPSALHAGALDDAAQSKAAAAVAAATLANEQNPAGNAQAATAGELSVASANLPVAKPEDAKESIERVQKALKGDLESARAEWAKARGEAVTLQAELAKAESDAKLERAASAEAFTRRQRELQDQIDGEKAKAERAQRRLLNIIFHGGGASLVLLGIGCFTFLSAVPFAGPRVGVAFIVAGAASIAAGVVANYALSNPWIVWLSVGVGLLALVGVAIGYANHFWQKSAPVTTA